MPQPIDLTSRVVPKKPAPTRVSTQATANLPTPPAGGVVHGLPRPTGQVSRQNPAQGGAPVAGQESLPSNVQQAIQAVKQEADVYIPPIDPSTPPYKLETVEIEQLQPAEQARIRSGMQETLQRHAPKQSAPKKPIEDSPSIASQAIPGWRDPNRPWVAPSVPNPKAFPQLQQPSDETMVEIDIAPPDSPEPAAPAASVASKPPAEEKLSTLGGDTLTNCPHCDWPLSMPDIPEPSNIDKQAFLQSILGQKPFVKEYDLLGGALRVTFRTLTSKELDVVFAQAAYDRQQHNLSEIDFWEKVNRYRLYLQLLKLEAPGQYTFDLPDGLSPETNVYAQAHWKLPEPEHPRDTGLPHIEQFIISDVLSSEILYGAIHNKCARYNRLVAKLGALVDNSDFWKPTS